MPKLVSKKVVSNADVYDITTAYNHNFFANGVLVHNCG
jgi:intein/homing endonuclease